MHEPPEPTPRLAWEGRPAFRELFLLHVPGTAEATGVARALEEALASAEEAP